MKLHEDSRIFSHIHSHELFVFIQDINQELEEVIELIITNIYFDEIEIIVDSTLGGSSQSIVLIINPTFLISLFLVHSSCQYHNISQQLV